MAKDFSKGNIVPTSSLHEKDAWGRVKGKGWGVRGWGEGLWGKPTGSWGFLLPTAPPVNNPAYHTCWDSVSVRILNCLFFKRRFSISPSLAEKKKKRFLTAGFSQPRRGASCWAAGSPVQVSWIIQALLRGFFIPTETLRSHSAGICSRQSLASWQIWFQIHQQFVLWGRGLKRYTEAWKGSCQASTLDQHQLVENCLLHLGQT